MMKTGLMILLAGLLMLAAGAPLALAGGAVAGEGGPLTGRVLFNAWQRDGAVQVAVCNVSGVPQQVRVSVGTYDTAEHVYAGQGLTVENGTVRLVAFPLLSRRTPRGDVAPANFVFVDAGNQTLGRVGSMPIQNMPGDGVKAGLSDYLVWSGGAVRVSLAEPAADTARVVFMARSIQAGSAATEGRPATGSMAPATADDLGRLGLPAETAKQYAARLNREFAFVFPAGQSGWAAVEYAAPEAPGCMAVQVPVSRFTVGAGGGGMSQSFLLANPAEITLRSILPMTEGDAGATKLIP